MFCRCQRAESAVATASRSVHTSDAKKKIEPLLRSMDSSRSERCSSTSSLMIAAPFDRDVFTVVGAGGIVARGHGETKDKGLAVVVWWFKVGDGG